jgi:hypothetical protein
MFVTTLGQVPKIPNLTIPGAGMPCPYGPKCEEKSTVFADFETFERHIDRHLLTPRHRANFEPNTDLISMRRNCQVQHDNAKCPTCGRLYKPIDGYPPPKNLKRLKYHLIECLAKHGWKTQSGHNMVPPPNYISTPSDQPLRLASSVANNIQTIYCQEKQGIV